jgi:hypothetical protein
MKVLNYKRTNGANDQRGRAEGVELNLSLHVVTGFEVERLESKPAKLSGLTAAGSWGFARTNLNLVAEFVALELAGMHGSSVITTGSHSRPSTDSFGGCNNGQRVSNIDVDNLVPPNGNRSEWVRDYNAFIEDFNFGANEHQVCADAEGCRPQASGDGEHNTLGQPKCGCQDGAQCENQTSQHVAASRSKDLSITHVSIIAGEK